MKKDLYEFKEKLLSSGIFRHQSGQEYTCTCPYCNDRNKHCYVLFKMDDDTPVLYNCFKCNSSGIVNKEFLDYFGIGDIKTPKYSFSKKLDITDTASVKMPTVLVDENDNIDSICNYINDRIGIYPSLIELQTFQYVGNPQKYTKEYLGGNDKNSFFNNRNWFKLTNGNIIGRYINDDVKIRWHRYNSNKINTSGLYTLNLSFDLYNPINVVIAEGVMDIISLYYNFKKFDNCIYIATLGKNYERGIKYVIDHGIFGDSVNIRIFKDSDVDIKSLSIDPLKISLFKKVDVYGNLIDKDYGVTSDKLDIHKINVLK